ncbi:solute carrier family 35 member F6-like isoform X2 [Coccinella septempunctata]|uniref:solute carrier family 35 member F6-like isoform X2 n=1 Tax=Coccinella septempunctata TaxID=41139 RepID=UPI001D063ACD|nr:solute carrier family 35 member F6-like isoform X2 [Coccinella septempunctata]
MCAELGAAVLGSLVNKYANMQESVGIDGEVRLFQHPFIQSSVGAFGMFMNLVLFNVLYFCFKCKSETLPDEHLLTRGNRHFNVFIFLLPGIFELIATTSLVVGLLFTYVSSLAMLRSSMIVFTALLSYFVFGHVPHWRETSGIIFVILGVVLVGLSDYEDRKESGEKDTTSIILGDGMAVVGSFLAGCQVVLEEKYLKKYDIPPLQAAGWEGLFGFIIMIPVHLIFYFIPVGYPLGVNSRGTLGDFPDGCVQVYNNWKIGVTLIIKIFTMASFNFCGLTVSKEMSSTTNKVLDSMRILPLWICSIAFFGQKFQFIQLIGFFLLMLGQALYNDIGCTSMERKCCPKRIIEEEDEHTMSMRRRISPVLEG